MFSPVSAGTTSQAREEIGLLVFITVWYVYRYIHRGAILGIMLKTKY